VGYTEFLAATLEMFGELDDERLAGAFNRIDIDHTGHITMKVSIFTARFCEIY